mmetsp:Transcript_174065/g.552651  ORF Transcript_174065/g.552651 Transcript_174065/m.552651 type:complete len:218 (-) Transcript_174065:568-1221(-)
MSSRMSRSPASRPRRSSPQVPPSSRAKPSPSRTSAPSVSPRPPPPASPRRTAAPASPSLHRVAPPRSATSRPSGSFWHHAPRMSTLTSAPPDSMQPPSTACAAQPSAGPRPRCRASARPPASPPARPPHPWRCAWLTQADPRALPRCGLPPWLFQPTSPATCAPTRLRLFAVPRVGPRSAPSTLSRSSPQHAFRRRAEPSTPWICYGQPGCCRQGVS